jgi:hypothetical protein
MIALGGFDLALLCENRANAHDTQIVFAEAKDWQSFPSRPRALVFWKGRCRSTWREPEAGLSVVEIFDGWLARWHRKEHPLRI